ncbi:hypothetical protein SVIOM342S_02194 [Streptomyces violaceorubidus]
MNATTADATAPGPGRIVLLTTSHRVAPGLLSWPAWQTLRTADRVLCADGAHPQLPYLREAGIRVDEAAPTAEELVDACAGGLRRRRPRDPERFTDPDTLDLARRDSQHLGYGHGIHYCLGAPLARLEGQTALATLLTRLPDLRLAADPAELRWRGGLIMRGLRTLPVAFTPSASSAGNASSPTQK